MGCRRANENDAAVGGVGMETGHGMGRDVRDGQTGRPARPGEAQPVLGPARQARLGNRAGPAKPASLIHCPSPARSGPKWAGPFSTKKAG